MKHYTLSEAYFIRQREIVIRVSESSPEEMPGHFTLVGISSLLPGLLSSMGIPSVKRGDASH